MRLKKGPNKWDLLGLQARRAFGHYHRMCKCLEFFLVHDKNHKGSMMSDAWWDKADDRKYHFPAEGAVFPLRWIQIGHEATLSNCLFLVDGKTLQDA
jgi:hypothetical protein